MNKKIVPIVSASKAISDFNKKLLGFSDIQSRLKVNQPVMPQQPQEEQGMTLDSYMRMNGIPVSYSTKSALASKMGMKNYSASKEHDMELLNVLGGIDQKTTIQNQSEKEQMAYDRDSEYKNKEFKLKNKELELKQKEIENNKMPTSDDLADKLLSKINS
jgi:hypothetical protein